MAEITTRSYPMVGTVGRGLFGADWVHAGKPLLFSGAIRVRRIGALDSADGYVYECWGRDWSGEWLADDSARWYDGLGNRIEPQPNLPVAGLATESDYYDVILREMRRLERSLAAGASDVDVEPIQIGLVECLQYRQ